MSPRSVNGSTSSSSSCWKWKSNWKRNRWRISSLSSSPRCWSRRTASCGLANAIYFHRCLNFKLVSFLLTLFTGNHTDCLSIFSFNVYFCMCSWLALCSLPLLHWRNFKTSHSFFVWEIRCFRSGTWRPTDSSPPSFIAFSASILWSRLSPHAEGKGGESERGRSPPDFPRKKRKKGCIFSSFIWRPSEDEYEGCYVSSSQGNFCSALTARDRLSKTRRGRIEGFRGEGRFKFYEESHIYNFLGETVELLPFQAFN